MMLGISKFHTLFFDVDETLYPSTIGVWQAISRRIDDYMVEKMHFDAGSVPQIRRDLFSRFGTTLRGLKQLYDVKEDDYLDYVHDIPVYQYLEKNPKLDAMLGSFPQRKVIFTNSDINHTGRILSALGIGKHFSVIIDIHAISPYCKPMPEAFQIALVKVGLQNGAGCVLIDDSTKNLLTATQFGFHTIKVGGGKEINVDSTINLLEELPSVIPGAY